MSLEVLIVGAGVGGLCLAQGLRREGINVTVFERDTGPAGRGQGYRLRINPDGDAALARCLPADLYALYQATANRPYMSRGVVFDEQLNELFAAHPSTSAFDPARANRVVNRRTLREVLLAGLGDRVRFGHEVAGFQAYGERVRLRFTSGAQWTGDLVVAADGIGSETRRALLPGPAVVDTGLRAIYGQARLTGRSGDWIPSPLLQGSCPVLGPGRRTLALGVFTPRRPIAAAVADLAPYADLTAVGDYMKWTLVAPAEAVGGDGPRLWQASPADLHRRARRMVDGWHPFLVDLVENSDPAVTFPLAIRASRPAPPWPAGPVTLLGDAVHATTPVGGIGANTALRDAAALTRALAGVRDGGTDALTAVAAYEEEMRGYGYAAVRSSLRGAEKIFRAVLPEVPGLFSTV